MKFAPIGAPARAVTLYAFVPPGSPDGPGVMGLPAKLGEPCPICAHRPTLTAWHAEEFHDELTVSRWVVCLMDRLESRNDEDDDPHDEPEEFPF